MKDKEEIKSQIRNIIFAETSTEELSVNRVIEVADKIFNYFDSLQEEQVSEELKRKAVEVGGKLQQSLILDGVDMHYSRMYAAIAQKKFIEGAQWQEEQMIDKACKWLLANDSYSKPTDMLVRDFRKAMSNEH